MSKKKKITQPKWCDYPDATAGILGCWSLVSGKITSEDRCKNCEFYKPTAEASEEKEKEG